MKILIGGDFCPTNRIEKLVNEDNSGEIFAEIREIVEECDYSILNLEAPVLYESAAPAEKTGPTLSCSPLAIKAIKNAGFKAVSLANNHFYDFGESGVDSTLKCLEENSIEFMGGGKDIYKAQRIHYIHIEGKKIGFINICEKEWSIATAASGGSAPLNPVSNHYQIKEAKNNADYVIVIVHGGIEHYQLPLPRMQEEYRFFIDSGADVVVNHHQHCYSGYEIYNNKPIFYGLGNLCFDTNNKKRNKLWEEGYLVKLILNRDIEFELIPYNQCGEQPKINLNVDRDAFNQKLKVLNEIIANPGLIESKFIELNKQFRLEYLASVEPIQNRYLNALQRRRLLPLFNSRKNKQLLLNLIRCESHKDMLEESLKTDK